MLVNCILKEENEVMWIWKLVFLRTCTDYGVWKGTEPSYLYTERATTKQRKEELEIYKHRIKIVQLPKE